MKEMTRIRRQEDDTSQFQLVIDKKADLVNLDRPEVFLPLLQKAQPVYTLRTDLLKIPADGTTLCTQHQSLRLCFHRYWRYRRP